MKKALIGVLSFAFIATSVNADIAVADPSEFSLLSQSHLKQSPNINASQIRLLERNMIKSSVRSVLGPPHFNTWFFPANNWEYRYNVVNGQSKTEDCLFKLKFEKKYLVDLKTSSKECLDILSYKYDKAIYRGVERAQVYFKHDKFDGESITNSIDWNVLADEIKRNKPEKVFVSAYTDSTGGYLYNLELASKRADTVAKNLLIRGVKPELLEVNNVGKTATFSERKVVVSW